MTWRNCTSVLMGCVMALSSAQAVAELNESGRQSPEQEELTITLTEQRDRPLSEAGIELLDDTAEAESASRLEDVEISGPAEIVFNRFLAIQRTNGNLVELYEPAKGEIFISEDVLFPNRSLFDEIDVDEMSAIEIFEYLMPGMKPPERLLAAYKRSQEGIEFPRRMYRTEQPAGTSEMLLLHEGTADGQPEVRSNSPEDPGLHGRSGSATEGATEFNERTKSTRTVVNVDDSACSASWFNYRCRSISPYHYGRWDWQVFWNRRTGTSWFTRSNNEYTASAACSYRGTITYTLKYRLWLRWSTKGSWTVRTGHFRWISISKPRGRNFDIRSKVHNAVGNGYHHCGYGHD